MKKKDINIFLNMDMSEEAFLKRQQENFKDSQENPENASYWFSAIEAVKNEQYSILQLPQTKIVPITFEWWQWLRSDKYTDDKIAIFNDFLNEQLADFMDGQTLFMKTGVFSNKFKFSSAIVQERAKIGEQFLDMFYMSMLVGADHTAEVVFRELIADKENRQQIYEGMPLHTEFRVFYDFDTKEVLGTANYWHPEVMEGKLSGEDALYYSQEKEQIVSDYNQFRNQVSHEVKTFMTNVELHGQWSVDVMKNGNDFWLIDMARMHRSALVNQMETV